MTEVLTGAKLGITPIYQCCFSDSESLSLHPGGQIAFKSTQSCYVRTLALLAHKQSNAHDKGRRKEGSKRGKKGNECNGQGKEDNERQNGSGRSKVAPKGELKGEIGSE